MIILIGKYCNFEGCTKKPSFGYSETGERLFCFKHKNPRMEMIRRKNEKFISIVDLINHK